MARPKGSKNKKTLARELAKEKEQKAYEQGKKDQVSKTVKTTIGFGILGIILLKLFGIGVKTTIYKK